MPQDLSVFEDIIAPLTRERFLSDYWDKSFLHVRGQKDRFARLLPWQELNTILEWHNPMPPQLRLFQDGQQTDTRRYIDGQPGALKLNAGGLVASLAQGATLILDSVDMFAPRVRELAGTIQDVLQGDINVNLYAGWRTQKGFDVHWDPQDLIVLQLSGRKRWKVFAPTRLHPLSDDIEPPSRPAGNPVWDGILEDGDMLYVPRGWWHEACPLDEPSLHLTFSIAPPNGADFLRWWMRRMLRHAEVRKNLPQGRDDGQTQKHLADLRKLMEAGWNQDLLAEFLREQGAGRRPRPCLRLPHAVQEQRKPLTMATRIRLSALSRLSFSFDSEQRAWRFTAGGGDWFFPAELLPAFERLSGQASISFQDLCAGIDDKGAIAKLTGALEILANAGVLHKEDPDGI